MIINVCFLTLISCLVYLRGWRLTRSLNFWEMNIECCSFLWSRQMQAMQVWHVLGHMCTTTTSRGSNTYRMFLTCINPSPTRFRKWWQPSLKTTWFLLKQHGTWIWCLLHWSANRLFRENLEPYERSFFVWCWSCPDTHCFINQLIYLYTLHMYIYIYR